MSDKKVIFQLLSHISNVYLVDKIRPAWDRVCLLDWAAGSGVGGGDQPAPPKDDDGDDDDDEDYVFDGSRLSTVITMFIRQW